MSKIPLKLYVYEGFIGIDYLISFPVYVHNTYVIAPSLFPEKQSEILRRQVLFLCGSKNMEHSTYEPSYGRLCSRVEIRT